MATDRKVAIVTGSQQGIGFCIAQSLAEQGYSIALVDVRMGSQLEQAVAAIKELGVEAHGFALDIASIGDHDSVLESIWQKFGVVHCLVNNAGVSVISRGDLLDVSQASYDRCLDINTRGTFFLTQAFAKRLIMQEAFIETHRCIINITSSNAIAVSINRGEYCISKAAASMATQLFAHRLADQGIGVYEVQPGLIETEMTAPSREKYSALMQQGLTSIQRWGQPSEVARVVVSMATGLLPYTVGQIIAVDGGLLAAKF